MELNCKKCKHSWIYKGNKKPNKEFPQYISCPRCRKNFKIGGKE